MSETVEVQIVHAFVKDGTGGNPAGIVLDAGGLTAAQKQRVAQQVGLPETAFVSPSALASIKLEFFTPTRQIAHCGHATIATFALLRQRGLLSADAASKETIDGLRAVRLDGELAFMSQTAPRVEALPAGEGFSPQAIARSLGLAGEAWPAAADAPCIVSTGNRFLLVDVGTPQALAGLAPDLEAIRRLSEALDLIGVYAYARVPGEQARATTRMFAPRYGIAEEAATGMAAGPLACRLWLQGHVRETVFELEQGRFMAAPSVSRLLVRLETAGGDIVGLEVGGAARWAAALSVEL